MRCPFCDFEDTKVVDSRPVSDGREIKRRRECPNCKRRFTTYERPELEYPLIIKKNGERQPYNRQKVLSGLKKACEKRAISVMQLEAIADTVEAKLLESGEKEVPSSFIGEIVMDKLSQLDHVAYVRFASVYREFEELEDFKEAVEELLKRRRGRRHKDK